MLYAKNVYVTHEGSFLVHVKRNFYLLGSNLRT